MIISAYSDRIYKKNVSIELQNLVSDCNDIKIEIYSKITNDKLELKDVNTTFLTNRYHVNTYYANMIINEVKSVIKRQDELQKFHIERLVSDIDQQGRKLVSFYKKLDFWRKAKREIIAYRNGGCNKAIFPYTFKHGKVVHSKYGEYEPWEFELYADKRIRQIKRSIYNAKNRLNRLNQQLTNMKKKPSVVCFGSRDFFKKQFTVERYINDHDLWRVEFQHKRHHRFTISGCAGMLGGSRNVRYNVDSKTLSIMSHSQGPIREGGIYARQSWFRIPCVWKYHEAEYLKATINRETVAYEILDFGKYFIIKAIFEYNHATTLMGDVFDGVNAIDINIDRFALTNIDKHGNLIGRKVIYFDLDGINADQATKIIEKAAIEVSEFCKANGKPLVRENITNIKFKDAGDKKLNKKLTQFAYDKMIVAIDRRLTKDGFMVYKVNPKYTSQQGKIKYMAAMGLSIHESAAFCIGRRLMFKSRNIKNQPVLYYEDLGKYKKFGAINVVAKSFKQLSINTIYKLHKIPVKINEHKKLTNYIKAVNDYVHN